LSNAVTNELNHFVESTYSVEEDVIVFSPVLSCLWFHTQNPLLSYVQE
jgi:hypothetical protein